MNPLYITNASYLQYSSDKEKKESSRQLRQDDIRKNMNNDFQYPNRVDIPKHMFYNSALYPQVRTSFVKPYEYPKKPLHSSILKGIDDKYDFKKSLKPEWV